MALPDANVVSPVPVPVPDAARVAGKRALYAAALDRLPRLHAEAVDTLKLGRLLARAPQACVILMLAGAALLLLTGYEGGGELKRSFTWTVLVLIGVIAITRTTIRGAARSLRRVPLQEAAADLRILLLYSGAAWGSGAFLIMPAFPAPALVALFALLPCLALALCLKNDKGVAWFTLPVTIATSGAAMMGAWPLDIWVAGFILVAGLVIVFLPVARSEITIKKPQPIILPY